MKNCDTALYYKEVLQFDRSFAHSYNMYVHKHFNGRIDVHK